MHYPLFGDLWMTGEISVMFGEAGCGKSILGVHIADAVARGIAIEPFENDAGRQKVLYLDLGSSPGHFTRRYNPDEGSRRSKPWAFSKNLVHFRPSNREIGVADLEPLIERTGARVLIIDSLAHLMRSVASSKEAASVMRELRRLRRLYGLSILVVADATRMTPARRGIEVSDLPFAGMLALFADNVFAIGRAGADPAGRYIKHIKPGATPLIYGAAHVPWFRITKRANFTRFQFQSFARETVLRGGDNDRGEWDLVRRIRELSAKMSVRKIAAMLKMSKSTVQRYVELSRNEAFAPPPPPPPQPDRWGEALAEPLSDDEWEDEYDEAFADALDREVEAASEEERIAADREGYLLQVARANAREKFKRTGARPTLAETLAEMRPNTRGWPERWECYGQPAMADERSDMEQAREQDPIEGSGLERAVDSNGNEIFVEKRHPHTGDLQVWYQARKSRSGIPTGTYIRWVRKAFGITGNDVTELPRGSF